jgi:cell division protein ZapA (FtsZ GTPase activity inhibitor)
MRFALLVALCLFSTGARAEFSASEFLERYQSAKEDVAKFYSNKKQNTSPTFKDLIWLMFHPPCGSA